MSGVVRVGGLLELVFVSSDVVTTPVFAGVSALSVSWVACKGGWAARGGTYTSDTLVPFHVDSRYECETALAVNSICVDGEVPPLSVEVVRACI